MKQNFILLHPEDNVLVCIESSAEGVEVDVDGQAVRLPAAIEVGHKIARHALYEGDKVVKYGAPIGSMLNSASRGEHVHLHNMRSDYIPSHTRNRRGGGPHV